MTSFVNIPENDYRRCFPVRPKQSFFCLRLQLTRFKDQNPSAIKEQKNAKTKLNRVSECFDVVNVVVETLPEVLSARVEQEKRVSCQADENLKLTLVSAVKNT